MSGDRTSSITRQTLETEISVTLDLDGSGQSDCSTGLPFFDHMLDQFARHGMLDLKIKALGDLVVDAHHTVEDVGISIGQALAQALGDKEGLTRFGHAYVPLDESLSRVVVDFCGRPSLTYNVQFTRPRIGDFDVDLLREFFQGFVNHSFVGLHVDNLRGRNAHHQAESIFKAFGRAIRMAIAVDNGVSGIPSTKGVI
ncbi:MAG: imidazoleglycerol-phosphate dehydratase HisB [Gammaproteobacteria bacterium]|nr:imidazoleglycerol-phosphate dehydratase HisB [Gammaproteobacteria bacterium]